MSRSHVRQAAASTAVRGATGIPGRNGFKHRPRFGVIVEVGDEAAQIAAFDAITALGYAPRVVCV